METKKTWIEKLQVKKEPQVKKIDKDFWGYTRGDGMYISTPQIIEDYIKQIAKGKSVDTVTMRNDLAVENNAVFTCPLTTGIFLRIVAEAANEQLQQGVALKNITPFWRMIEPNSPLAKKLTFGQDFLMEQRKKEKID
jgi:hypothetical protein